MSYNIKPDHKVLAQFIEDNMDTNDFYDIFWALFSYLDSGTINKALQYIVNMDSTILSVTPETYEDKMDDAWDESY